jgi:group II intron reverse transcriptase/maturase
MNIGEMQRKLSLWAEQDKDHRFFDLFHLLYDKDWLRLAHDYVKQNAGSITAGCDGINLSTFDEELESNLQRLIEELKSERFEPQPVRRVYITKPNGKVRPLGIPSIRDRIVQEALRMILEPIYEADFSQYSFGFRPNRCTMDAIKCVMWSAQEGKKCFWIVEGDISSYFDTINHRRLIKILRRRIKDEKIIRLIWKFLRAGVMEGHLFRDTKLGTPQGGIISPLLANIYLNDLDKYMEKYTGLSAKEKTNRRKQGQANFVYVRYADDFIVLCNGTRKQAEELREELYAFLKKGLRLNLSKEKTKITHLNDGFNFLGFKVQRGLGHKGMTTKVLIPGRAVKRLRDKIRVATDRTTHRDSASSKVLALNRIISGWCRYYQYASKANRTFNRIAHEAFWCLAHWLGRKHQLSIPEIMKRYRQGNTLVTKEYRLKMAVEFPTLAYKKRFLKANPYTTQRITLREELPQERYWTGYESRAGMADLRLMILERDRYACQMCDKAVTSHTCQIDHIKPVRRFKKPVDANSPNNLWTLCIPCHKEKTESDRQMESRMR